MDIFGVQPNRISPVAKREFSNRQRFSQTSGTANNFTDKLEGEKRSEGLKNQSDIRHEPQQLKRYNHQVHAHAVAAMQHIAPASTSNTSAIEQPMAAETNQMAAITRIEIARVNQEQSNRQPATFELPKNRGGATQYKQLERETNPEAFQLSEYA